MHFKALIAFIVICLLGLSVANTAKQPVIKKVVTPGQVFEPKKKLFYSLICNGESDHTPLLKRKYKSKGIKEFCLLIETPDFGQFIYSVRDLRTDTIISYSSSAPDHYYLRGPPIA